MCVYIKGIKRECGLPCVRLSKGRLPWRGGEFYVEEEKEQEEHVTDSGDEEGGGRCHSRSS